MPIKPGWEGRFFEDFEVGDIYRSRLGRTVTEADNTWFTLLTMNTHPIHLDAEYGKASEFGQILVNGTFTFALMVGLSVGDTTLGTLVANLGYDKLVMPHPVFIGDTLRAETEIVALKDSRSRPNAGIVTFRHVMHNQRDEMVCECLRMALIQRTPS